MKHTPAPWNVTKGTNGFCPTWQVEHKSEFRHATVADCGAIVNQVYQGSTDHYIGERVNTENEANAKLIAAAPDLLSACKEAESIMSQTGSGQWTQDHENKFANALIGLRQAIEKAKK